MRQIFWAEIREGRAFDPWREVDFALSAREALPDGTFVEVELVDGVAEPRLPPLAQAGSAFAGLIALGVEYGCDPIFPSAVMAEVDALFEGGGTRPPGTDDPALEDLTAMPFVTIDNADSRDLDQALAIERAEGGFRILYALADPSHYVRPGTALFEEALARGASFYFPGWMVPMLPSALSEGLVSLNPDVLRRALVFDMRLDADGGCEETLIHRALIRSRGKLTYDGVQAFLDAPEGHAWASEPFASSLRALQEVGELRIANAAARGVVHHRRRSVEVGLHERRSFVMYGGLRNDVERFNEQISLLCNMEGARLVREGDAHVQPVFRVHPAPPEERVKAFARDVARLAEAHGKSWRWDREGGQSLASFLEALPWEGEDARLSRAIQRQAILVNVRSSFTEEAGAHHGVGAEVYARFSAPMREIVGVFLHKELLEHLAGEGEEDDALRERIVEAANRSKGLQRKLTVLGNRLALDELFSRDLGHAEVPIRRGTVMGVTNAKVHVSLDEPPVDVKLYRRDLERSFGGPLRADALRMRAADGRVVLRTGDPIDLRVEGRDERRDRWILSPVGRSEE